MASKKTDCNYWTKASGAISLANPGLSGGWAQQKSNVINCGDGSDYTCQVVGCSGTTYSILQYKAPTTP